MTDQELARALFNAGLLTQEQVQAAAEKRTAQKNFAQVIVELGWVSPEQIAQVIPGFSLSSYSTPQPPVSQPTAPPPYGAPSPYGTQPPYNAPPPGAYGAPYAGAPAGAPYAGAAPAAPPIQRKPGVVDIDAIKQGWQLVSAQLGMWIVAIIITQLISGAVSQIIGMPLQFMVPQPQINPQNPMDGVIQMYKGLIPMIVLSSFLQIPVTAFLQGGLIRMGLRQLRTGKMELGDLFSAGPYILPLMLATFLIQLASFTGLFALCVGSFVVYALFLLTIPLIVDRNLSAVEAMKKSWQTLVDHLFPLIGIILLLGLLQMAGVLACCVGVLFTMPLVPATTVVLYDRFFPQENAPETPTPGPYPPPPIPSPF